MDGLHANGGANLFHRKGIVIICLLVTMVMATTPSARAQIANHVVINEFELNPPGDDAVAGAEFVEFYNPTSASVNIGGWKVSTTHSTVTLAIPVEAPCCGATYIPAKGYYEFYFITNTKWLENEDESIILRDVAGKEIDRTPAKSDPYDDARTWQRNPDGGADWVFQTSTRGLPIPEFQDSAVPTIYALTILVVLLASRKIRSGIRRN